MNQKGSDCWQRSFIPASWWQVALAVSCLFTPLPALAGPHDGLTTYEGSKTCMPCHAGKAEEVHGSAHYQFKGDTPAVPSLGVAGKLGSINDFCTYPDINWLFEMTNLAGQKVVVGCGSCHVGLGAKPTTLKTQAQLENIDCLMCHSEVYKRKAVSNNGQLKFVPDPAVDMRAALTTIQMPSKATCLTRCHVGAGGGPGLKQGDLDPAHVNPPRSLDVHMSSQASGGAGLSCLDCHKAQNHRIAGRGNDIRETDLNVKVDCTNCHGAAPHGNRDLNRHTARVSCTVCHIPQFARGVPTDVYRDFQHSEADAAVNRYEPVRVKQANVKPVYKFYNGLSFFYRFGAAITPNAAGNFTLAAPLGSISDPNAKLTPFKQHRGKMAYDQATRRLIPLKSKVVWETGNMTQAVLQGAAAVGWPVSSFGYANSYRFMSLHHEVAPKENALTCAKCHDATTGPINFTTLGYTPKTQRNGTALCSSCHSPETADFYRVHRVHVAGENLSCSTCHNF